MLPTHTVPQRFLVIELLLYANDSHSRYNVCDVCHVGDVWRCFRDFLFPGPSFPEGGSKPGADEQEHETPILSLCHGIFTD